MVFRQSILLAVILGLLQVASASAQKPNPKPQANQKPPIKEPAAKDQKEKDQKEKDPKEASAKEKTPNDKEAAKQKLIAITPEREAAVAAFVERNHPELAGLLTHLKAKQPKEYERAVRDLFRVTEKLAMVSEKDGKQYDLELQVWKAQSRAQLLVARLKMTDPESADREELTNQLREILSEQLQARLEVMKLERERVSGRLEKLNDDIGRMERDREGVIEGHLKTLTSQVNATAKPRQAEKAKPADKKPSERKPNKP